MPLLSANLFQQKKIIATNGIVKYIGLTFFFLNVFTLSAQEISQHIDTIDRTQLVDTAVVLSVDSIEIRGNKKTKKYIIRREMRFKKGDCIPAARLFEILEESRELIYNTNLFEEVTLIPSFISGSGIKVIVMVKERWYIYPTPQFQLSDRNINEWIERYNADLNRVTYGIKFAHYNLSGRRDQLRVFLLNGFSRNINLIYSSPYSNRKLTEGFAVGGGFSQTRAAIFGTNSNNAALRYSRPDRDFVRENYFISGSYISRKGYYKRHTFSIGYAYNKVEDSVVTKYNSNYFNNGNRNHVGIPEIGYSFQYIRTNNINYPLKGKVYSLSLTKRGFGTSGSINMLTLGGSYNRYLSLGKNWYHSFNNVGFVKLPFKQPYINQQAMGYNEFYLRGLENYVIDGVASILSKYTLKKKLVEFNIPVPIKNNIISKVPFQIFAKTYADAGYTYNKYNGSTKLNNRFLYSSGFGIDILSLYDINFSVEYSFNQLGEKGLFLHARGGF